MQGASPLASPGLDGARHWLSLRCRKPKGGRRGAVACLPCHCGTRRGAQRFWLPADLAFSLLSCPHPPDPLPLRGRGSPKVYFAGGSAPGSPATGWDAALVFPVESGFRRGLRLLRDRVRVALRYPAGAWQLRRGSGEQCRQPRRGGTGGEELRRLRWSSPPGQGEPVPHRVQPPLRTPQRQGEQVPPGVQPPLRTPQRQGQPVPPEAKAHTTTIFSLPPAIAAQGKPRRRRAERREQTEQYAGEH